MDLSEKIKKIREDNNLTQDEMAERIYVTRQAISKWERGINYPSLDVIRLICKQFGVSMNYLLEAGEENKSKEYKAVGYKHKGYLALNAFIFCFIAGIVVSFNILAISKNAETYDLVIVNVLLGIASLLALSLLVQSIFPIGRVLVEYNDFGIRIKTLRGVKEVPFEKIIAMNIKATGTGTLGDWSSPPTRRTIPYIL